jgi:cardiolipin synthase
MKNLPNLITLFRLLLALPIFYLLLNSNILLAFIIAVVAFLSDLVDGYLARKFSATSKLGELLDPFADRILVLSILAGEVAVFRLPEVIFFLVLLRELIAVTGFLLIRRFWLREFSVIFEGKTIATLVYIFLASSIIVSFPVGFYYAIVGVYYLSFVFYIKSIWESSGKKRRE